MGPSYYSLFRILTPCRCNPMSALIPALHRVSAEALIKNESVKRRQSPVDHHITLKCKQTPKVQPWQPWTEEAPPTDSWLIVCSASEAALFLLDSSITNLNAANSMKPSRGGAPAGWKVVTCLHVLCRVTGRWAHRVTWCLHTLATLTEARTRQTHRPN